MDWLRLLLQLTKLLSAFARFLGDKQLIEVGAAQAYANGLSQLQEKVRRAKEIESTATDHILSDGLRSPDENQRD